MTSEQSLITTDNAKWLDRGVLGKLLLIIVLSGLIRATAIKEIGIDHFDAGAYAESALAVRDSANALFPKQHFLSPPVFFGLAGSLSQATGIAIDQSLSWVSAFFGTLGILVVFLIGRSWIGPREGLFAASVIALSPHHIILSRCGLTDATFCTLFILALWLHTMAHRRNSLWLTIAAGLAVGLAWNTKYHGWLVGVIAAAATLPDFIRGSRLVRRQILVRHGLATLIAMACYAPWFLHICQMDGGYGALAAEHRRFLGDAGHFLSHAGRHLESWRFFDKPIAHFGFLAGLLFITPGNGRKRLFLIVALFAMSFFASSAAVVVGLALIGTMAAIRGGEWRRLAWPIAFFSLFFVLTPLYRPYNRLAIPLLLAAAVLAPTGVQFLGEAMRLRAKLTGALVIGVAIALGAMMDRGAKPAATIYGKTDGVRVAARRIATELTDESIRGTVYVVGEPPAVHYLREAGIDAIAVDEMDTVTERPTTFVFGIYATRTPSNRGFLDRNKDRVTLLSEEAVVVSDIRLLDDFSPAEARGIRERGEKPHRLAVYRLK